MKKAEPDNEKVASSGAEEPVLRVDASSVTSEQLEELKSRAAKADEYWDRLLRTTADLDNFKKRAAREKQDAIKYANEALMTSLATVLDNFDMALAAADSASADGMQAFKTGVAMIHQQLKNALLEAGLEEVDAAGLNFDPNWHEAVAQKETSEVPEGQVVQQIRKGYKLRDRLLRPASVVVAKNPPRTALASED
jgi:molecular chaperone GrpE